MLSVQALLSDWWMAVFLVLLKLAFIEISLKKMSFSVKHGYKMIQFFEIGLIMHQVIPHQSWLCYVFFGSFLHTNCTKLEFQVEVNITASLQHHVEEYSRTLLIATPKGFS